jgi:hypothetical protein
MLTTMTNCSQTIKNCPASKMHAATFYKYYLCLTVIVENEGTFKD